MASGRCPYGEEWGRGGVARTGGRDLCPALRAGKIPVLLLLSVSEGRTGASFGNHDSRWARTLGGRHPVLACGREFLRRSRLPVALYRDGNDVAPERPPLFRGRGRPGGRRLRLLMMRPWA